MKVRIKGTGSMLPAKWVSNPEIAQIVDTSDEWIRERTGIGGRYLSTGETVAGMAAEACRRALEMAGVSAQDVDMILVASCSSEMLLPCSACQVQEAIGADRAVAFDLNAACAGFLFALNTANAYLQSGAYQNALVVGAEVLSKIMDWEDRGTCVLFGDGAGAVLLEAEEDTVEETNGKGLPAEEAMSKPGMGAKEHGSRGGILGYVQHSEGNKGSALRCQNRPLHNPYYKEEPVDTYVQMDGREIFKFAVRQIPLTIEELLEKVQIDKSTIDLFILHQANARIIEGIAKRLDAAPAKFPMNIERVGNMSSASIPVLLDELNREGRLKPDMKLVLSGFGAGLTYGACVLEW